MTTSADAQQNVIKSDTICACAVAKISHRVEKQSWRAEIWGKILNRKYNMAVCGTFLPLILQNSSVHNSHWPLLMH